MVDLALKSGIQEVDLRVSTLPTVHGEKIVMRLLKKTGRPPCTCRTRVAWSSNTRYLADAITKPYWNHSRHRTTDMDREKPPLSTQFLTKLNKPSVYIVTLEDPC